MRNIVGSTDASIRFSSPASSNRAKRSGGDTAAAAASTAAAHAIMKLPTFSRGWNVARSITHDSRGLIQEMSSGSTPVSSNQQHASIPVFPAPITT